MSILGERIKTKLLRANEHNESARKFRIEAGHLLAEARALQPTGAAWYTDAGLDQDYAELLINLSREDN